MEMRIDICERLSTCINMYSFELSIDVFVYTIITDIEPHSKLDWIIRDGDSVRVIPVNYDDGHLGISAFLDKHLVDLIIIQNIIFTALHAFSLKAVSLLVDCNKFFVHQDIQRLLRDC
jgi:hypothetical protein